MRLTQTHVSAGCINARDMHLSACSETPKRKYCGVVCFPLRWYLFVRVFVSLQGLHDGQLSIVFEAGRLVPQDLLQQTQGQRSDGVLGDTRAWPVT